MKKWKKIILIIAIAPFALVIPVIVFAAIFGDEAKPEKVVVLKKFSELSELEQKDSIAAFVNGDLYSERYFILNENIKEGLKAMVKYPETLEYYYNEQWVDGKSTYIVNRNKITVDPKKPLRLTATVDFKSENSFGQKVRKSFFIIFDFNGSEPYKIIDANIIQ